MNSVAGQVKSVVKRITLVGAAFFLVSAYPAAGFVLADDPAPSPSDSTSQASQPSTDTTSTDSTEPSTQTPQTQSSDQSPASDNTPAADTSATTPTPSTTPSTPTSKCPKPSSGVNRPGGAASGTYTFNTSTCLWENDYYTWNPMTATFVAKYQYPYVYNTSTGQYDSKVWDYYPSVGKYLLDTFSVAQPPAGAQVINGSSPSASVLTVNTGNTLNMTNLNNATVQNILATIALTGNASVLANTNGGSALSGNAMAMANILNMLQSSSSLANAITFTANVNGNVQGDLLLDPASLVQPASGSESLANTSDLQVNNQTDASIGNNVNLTAVSGDATVAKNTNAGDATTGNADAVANIVNMINSMVGSNQSFVGVINILGDLNGNILMPQQFLDSLIASNAPRSTVTINDSNTTDTNVDNTTTQGINNQVTAEALSGSATVDKNTSAGNATTGKATTNVTIFNLTGEQVVGKNSLLVFVNVLGNWVGMIMNAPAGATAAAFGGDVTVNDTNLANTDITNTTNQSINNNVNVTAQSGDALVQSNTKAGNATSGDANAAVNLANIENDQFSLSDWFGVLFINVFGSWNGSFGVYNPLALNNNSGSSDSSAPSSTSGAAQALLFKAPYALAKGHSGSSAGSSAGSSSSGATPSLALADSVHKVLGAAHFSLPKQPAAATSNHFSINPVAIVIVTFGVSLLGIERYLTIRARS